MFHFKKRDINFTLFIIMRAEADSVLFGQDIECKLLMKYLFSRGSLHKTYSVFFYNQSEFNLKSNCKLTFEDNYAYICI